MHVVDLYLIIGNKVMIVILDGEEAYTSLYGEN